MLTKLKVWALRRLLPTNQIVSDDELNDWFEFVYEREKKLATNEKLWVSIHTGCGWTFVHAFVDYGDRAGQPIKTPRGIGKELRKRVAGKTVPSFREQLRKMRIKRNQAWDMCLRNALMLEDIKEAVGE